jgi:large subunit ribosomal protein L30
MSAVEVNKEKLVATKEIVEKKIKTITIQQTGSPIRRDGRQKLYLKSLGLNKMNRVRTLKDCSSVRGAIKKVAHMVQVLDGDKTLGKKESKWRGFEKELVKSFRIISKGES